ncbi:MAG TPA: glycosyltransferase family 4 protein [Rubricoccaceae bacterium]|jgi:glycosyltransferase involved in cell wall biosynthesis
MPRIVCLLPLPPPATGQSVVTATFLDALRPHATVEVVDTADRAHVWRTSRTFPPARIAAWLGRLAEFRRRLVTPPDAVYLTPASSVAGLLRDVAALALVPRGVRVVAHAHMGDYGGLPERRGVRALARWTVRRYERVLVPSEFAAAWLRRTVPEAHVEVVPNPVSAALRFTADDEAAARAARRGRPGHVLFLSNMIPAKGYVPLAHALATLAERGLTFTASFVGAWATEADRVAFVALLAGLGLTDRTDVPGPIPHPALRPVLAAASVIAFPSAMPESFGMGMLEAMGAGCAVVATGHAAAPEIARDGLDGRLVPPGDAGALADALADVLGNADRYGASAAARARDAFAPEPFEAMFVRALLGTPVAPPGAAEVAGTPEDALRVAALSFAPPPTSRHA